MKISPDLMDYVRRTELALLSNPPPTWPSYTQDSRQAWRYVARCFGAGLGIYERNQVIDVCKTLYGRWLVRLTLGHTPAIDNKDFVGWILEAMDT